MNIQKWVFKRRKQHISYILQNFLASCFFNFWRDIILPKTALFIQLIYKLKETLTAS